MTTPTPTPPSRLLKFAGFALALLAVLLIGGYIAEPTFLDGFKAVIGGVL